MPVAKQRAETVGDVRRSAPLVDHGQLEGHSLDIPGAADPLEEIQIVREAAERDVLAVVRRGLGVALPLGQGLHLAPERRPGFEERDVMPRVDKLERRREAGQAAADHRRPHLASAAPTTRSFATGESLGAPPKTSNPSCSIRSSVER